MTAHGNAFIIDLLEIFLGLTIGREKWERPPNPSVCHSTEKASSYIDIGTSLLIHSCSQDSTKHLRRICLAKIVND